MRWLVLLPLLPVLFSAPCTTVDRDRLLAADLAAEIAPFSQLDPQFVLGPAPVPGTHRTFLPRELTALAARNGIQLDGTLPEICFERAVRVLTPEQIRTAMQKTLGTDDIGIEIVEFSRQPVPSGELTFARNGLASQRTNNPDNPVFWRGTLKYSSQSTLAVWATVRLHQQRSAVVAVRAIRSGEAITPADVDLASRDLFPFTPHLEALTDAIGRVARKSIASGALISEDIIETPPDVAAGDTVRVVVTNGSARITFEAIARTQGRKGDRIVLLNPESHHTFRAFVDGKGQAHIEGAA